MTMNPAIDKTVEVEELVCRGLNRIRKVEYDAGGKGINVSKTIHELGGYSVATGFLGGNNGQIIANVLKRKGIACDFVCVSGETRTNTKVVEDDGSLTELNEPGALIQDEDINKLKKKLLGYADEDTIFIFAGSIPKGVTQDIYREMICLVKEQGASVLLDADGEVFCRSMEAMYYAYPKKNAAYETKNQFMFGSELMVAPITGPNNKITRLGSTNLWLPEGDWFDFFRGTHYTSKAGRTMSVHRDIKEYPVFAKAGAIVPMQKGYALEAGNDLEIVVFPGQDNQFTLYEDAGDGSEFENGMFVKTEMTLEWGMSPVFTLKPAKGVLELLPKERNYQFDLRGYHQNVSVKVLVDGKEADAEAVYEEETRSIIVKVSAPVTSEIKLMVTGKTLMTDNGDLMKRCSDLMQSAYFEMCAKDDVIAILREKDTPFESKLVQLNFKLANSIEHQGLIEALLEQLTLEE